MKPSEYKARYDNLVVPRKNGPNGTVQLNHYRLNSSLAPPGSEVNLQKKKDFLAAFDKNGIDLDLCIHDGAKVINLGKGTALGKDKIRRLTSMCFVGKGAPEHCQIVLQLVEHWNLLGTLTLQQYADQALGLDCNGFVGNYLWHGRDPGAAWSEHGADKRIGPDTTIDGYFDEYLPKFRYQYVDSWEKLDQASTYILGRANPVTNTVIPTQDASGVAHIVISEPGHLLVTPMVLSVALVQIRVIESTASHAPGLTDSWYTMLANDTGRALFKFLRADMSSNKELYFKMIKVV
jgi:hypothetical protein